MFKWNGCALFKVYLWISSYLGISLLTLNIWYLLQSNLRSDKLANYSPRCIFLIKNGLYTMYIMWKRRISEIY